MQLNIAVFPLSVTFRDHLTYYNDDDVSFEESLCDEDEEYKEDNYEQRKVIIMRVIVTDVQNVRWSTCLCGEMEADKGEVTSRTCSTMYWFTWVGNVVVIIRTDEHIGC